uniref:Nuclear receptor domain-containing protein n=1 Tax=Caenorhabditis tropicalis TaxID=1561998 RepID=A0A1I7UVL1_9PELO
MDSMIWIWLIYGSFSVALSIAVFTILTCHSKFKPLFYRLVQMDMFMAYHIQCASLILKCVFRYTYAKYPFASEIWKKRFVLIIFATISYSILVTIPFCFASKTMASRLGFYAIMMNFETVFYFVLTMWIGYLTHLSLKSRSIHFLKSMRQLNYYLFSDIAIHLILLFGVMIPMVICYHWPHDTKKYILIFVLDVRKGPSECRICNRPAHGHHCGVATCKGCKTFFRRMCVSSTEVECKLNNDCFDLTKRSEWFFI